jgi:hypothetical protein
MNGVRSTPIVAVFGSSVRATLDPAEALGKAVADAVCILLTGGGRHPDEGSVKERAMVGARAAEGFARRAARVGVLGVESTRVRIEVTDSEVILEPNLGHGRNYLNAATCDVAVAFPGGPGTDSEVAFALALGRPVVLVGKAWDTSFPPGEDRSAREALVASARKRVKGTGRTALDVLVDRAYADLLVRPVRVERLGLDHPAGEVAATARNLTEGVGLHGDVPTLSDRPDLTELAKQYRDWLSGFAHR